MTFHDSLDYLKNLDTLRITISGDIGAGKSTFSKRLSLELDIPRIYIGGLMREEAARRGLSLDEFNQLLVEDDTIDRDLDELQKQKSKETKKGVFEGRTSWHFVENPDVKIFLGVQPKISAERIWGDAANHLRDKYSSIEEIVKANETRKQNEIDRYKKHYGIDVYDIKNFDIRIYTDNSSIDEVFESAIITIAEFLQS